MGEQSGAGCKGCGYPLKWIRTDDTWRWVCDCPLAVPDADGFGGHKSFSLLAAPERACDEEVLEPVRVV